jgi:putative oxidoreductase
MMLKSLGRTALSAIFVLGGADALRAPGPRVEKVDGAGIPHPGLAVRANAATMVLAGILLALGIAPKAAAGALLGSLIPTTLVGHPFWKEETPQARSMQLTHFLKNLGLVGGLLLILAEGGNAPQARDDSESAPSPSV